jgi:chemotaxis protein MotB
LRAGAHGILEAAADMLTGYKNRIEIRGHASRGEVTDKSRFADEWELSFYRAKAVADFLVREGKISEKRLRVTGCSYHNPAAASLFKDDESRNRRVEIVEVGEFIP